MDVVVVGAGVVGLAIARAAAIDGWRVLVIERDTAPGTGISSRNSEVIHAGLYYAPNSLKARLCVAGRRALYAYCDSRGIPHRRCGKLILATHPDQHARLDSLLERAKANGVEDLEPLTAAAAKALEPEIRCSLALLSPSTGIVDSHALMTSLVGDIESAGGALVLRTEFLGASQTPSGLDVRVVSGTEQISVSTRWLINCAGLAAAEVATRVEGVVPESVPRLQFAKGNYFSISQRPFRMLIYPLHDEASLGIHATVDLSNSVRFGPDVEWVEHPQYDVDAARADIFQAAIRAYWPGLQSGTLRPAYAGVRPKLVGPGESPADFLIRDVSVHSVRGLYNLFGIESPGLTASLALGAELASRLRADQ